MDKLEIIYTFKLESGHETQFVLKTDLKTLEMEGEPEQDTPDWAALEYHQCESCPLSSEQTSHCPLAEKLSVLVPQFDGLISHQDVLLVVETEQRKVEQKTSLQTAMSSLLGLVMATSGCPKTAYFRPMARFHLPLADPKETIYRAASMYLMGQYFKRQQGLDADWNLDGLRQIYDDITLVNIGISERLRAATKTDSSVNAVVILDSYAKLFPWVIDEMLDELKKLYAVYL